MEWHRQPVPGSLQAETCSGAQFTRECPVLPQAGLAIARRRGGPCGRFCLYESLAQGGCTWTQERCSRECARAVEHSPHAQLPREAWLELARHPEARAALHRTSGSPGLRHALDKFPEFLHAVDLPVGHAGAGGMPPTAAQGQAPMGQGLLAALRALPPYPPPPSMLVLPPYPLAQHASTRTCIWLTLNPRLDWHDFRVNNSRCWGFVCHK